MSINWDIYNKRLNVNGSTIRERQVERLKTNIEKHVLHNPSCKDILLNGKSTQLIINTGTKPHYKEFETLPGETVKTGDYIEWANRTWLVYEADADDEVYTDGKMYECNYKLYWQASTGKIISRWAYIQNASSYSNGESGNATLTLSSNQLLVIMPLDDETVNLETTSMAIDNKTSGNPKTYDLTRPDNITMKFGDKGCTYYIFTLKEFSSEKDKKVTLEDGSQVWICNYIPPTPPPTPTNPDKTTVFLDISSSKDYVKVGGSYSTFKGIITGEDGNVTDDAGTFSIMADFASRLSTNDTTLNQIKIRASDDCSDLVGETFELIFSVGYISVSKIITIENNT